MLKPQLYARISLAKLATNIAIIQKLNPSKKIMAIVKANGYGHGAVTIAKNALKMGATGIGTATITEALNLRKNGIDAPILCWLNGIDANYAEAIQNNINIGVSNLPQLNKIIAIAKKIKIPALVSIKVDTGLNRNGFKPAELVDIVSLLQTELASKNLIFQDIFSHLSHAETIGHETLVKQTQVLTAAINTFKQAGINPQETHLECTGPALAGSISNFTTLRIGIGLYGYNSLGPTHPVKLHPLMDLCSEVILVKRLKAGEGVSYDHTWVATQDTTIALIAGGYADGVSRALSNKFTVNIEGTNYPQIGTICMDQFLVDLGDNPQNITIGDSVTLFGEGENFNTATDWANLSGTIDYEIICHIGDRVERIYV